MTKQLIFFFALGFLCCAALAPFVMNLDIFSAIGLAVVIMGTVFSIFAALAVLCFGGWILWLACIDGLDSAAHALKHVGLIKES